MSIQRWTRLEVAAIGRAVVVAAAAGLAQPGCAPPERAEPWEGEVRDSAGITLVENEGPERTDEDAPWRAETTLRIDTLFGHVVDVAVDEEGRLYVLDQMAREVRIFSREGAPEGRLGRPGEGPGELSGFATSVMVVGDTVLVADWAEARVNRYLRDGTVLEPVEPPGTPGSRSWWSAGPDSATWVRALERWRDEENRWRGTDVLFRIGPDGAADSVLTFTYAESDLGSPEAPKVPLIVNAPSWAILPGGRIAWTATDLEELRIHDADGELRRIVRRAAWRRRPLTDAGHRALLELLGERFEMMGSSADFVERLDIVRHEQLPALTAVRAGPRGTIWVRRMGDPELVHPMALNSPDHPDWLGGALWDVLDTEGRYLGTVRLPPELRVTRITERAVYGVTRDALDVEQVVRLDLVPTNVGDG